MKKKNLFLLSMCRFTGDNRGLEKVVIAEMLGLWMEFGKITGREKSSYPYLR